ncbi:hypothetical protein Dip510_001128 [Elusimicrobium posterum]|uniref:hypothetical protein n=1 Tax=Elusimicrobium posterum TaxID=3116653 RepID=UPI003C78D8FF
MKNKLIFFIIVAVLILSSALAFYHIDKIKNIELPDFEGDYCDEDSDCIAVEDFCSQCHATCDPVNTKRTAINKMFLPALDMQKCPEETESCTAVSQHYTCSKDAKVECYENKCYVGRNLLTE